MTVTVCVFVGSQFRWAEKAHASATQHACDRQQKPTAYTTHVTKTGAKANVRIGGVRVCVRVCAGGCGDGEIKTTTGKF